MPQPLSGPGVGLPYATYLYPSELTNAPVDFNSNRLALAAGQAIPLPRGTWYVNAGSYCVVQYLDPTNGQWTVGESSGGGVIVVSSDGFNCRVANMTGCAIAAVVTGAGSTYVQATTTITPSAGNSTWSPVVGGALSLTTIANAGAGYGIPPLVLIPAPAPASSNANTVGGFAAEAYAILTGGTVSAISFINQGAGYQTAPTATIVPDPTDPNINSGITNATITLGLTGAGTLTGAICTNPGEALTAAQITTGLTLTVGGAGSGATLSAVIMQTVVGLTTVSTAGTGYPTTPLLTTVGGVPAAGALVTPGTTNKAWRPRPANIALAEAGGSITSISSIYDGGLFLGTPTAVIVGGAPTTAAVVTLSMGGTPDHVILQPTG